MVGRHTASAGVLDESLRLPQTDILEWIKIEKGLISCQDELGVGGDRQLEELVILWIAAGANLDSGRNQGRLLPKHAQKATPLLLGDIALQPRSVEHVDEFGKGRHRVNDLAAGTHDVERAPAERRRKAWSIDHHV